jgi:hypothetical protein
MEASRSKAVRERKLSNGIQRDEDEEIYTVQEYSRKFHYNVKTIYGKLRRKEIEGFKLPGGRKWLIRIKKIKHPDYVQKNKILSPRPVAETDRRTLYSESEIEKKIYTDKGYYYNPYIYSPEILSEFEWAKDVRWFVPKIDRPAFHSEWKQARKMLIDMMLKYTDLNLRNVYQIMDTSTMNEIYDTMKRHALR